VPSLVSSFRAITLEVIPRPNRADTDTVSTRISLSIGLAIAALMFGGWRMLVPGADEATQAAGASADTMIGTVSQALFSGAEASLEAQRSTTGSYAGTPLEPPIVLVRADTSGYCIEVDRAPLLQHVDGPGGTPATGHCT
jgi:hypothetical protein